MSTEGAIGGVATAEALGWEPDVLDVGRRLTDSPGGVHIVHSVDGTTVSSIAVGDHIAEPGAVVGLSISPDAILVRVDGPTDNNSATMPTQQVLVGTPR